MKLDFYNVNKPYIEYLQKAEYEKRGFTRVPNIDYGDKKQKFLCGIVLSSPKTNLKYFVGVTHYKTQKSENFLIMVDKDRQQVKGSLRFNYMFPVPVQLITRKEILAEPDETYKILLSKELKSINSHCEEIVKKANEVYKKVVNKKCSKNLILNSCDFTYLETKCIEYCKINNIKLPELELNHEKLESAKECTPWNDLLITVSKQKEKEKPKIIEEDIEPDR